MKHFWISTTGRPLTGWPVVTRSTALTAGHTSLLSSLVVAKYCAPPVQVDKPLPRPNCVRFLRTGWLPIFFRGRHQEHPTIRTADAWAGLSHSNQKPSTFYFISSAEKNLLVPLDKHEVCSIFVHHENLDPDPHRSNRLNVRRHDGHRSDSCSRGLSICLPLNMSSALWR